MLKKKKLMAIMYEVTKMKTCPRATVCESKVNMSKYDKESKKKEDDGV
jgi:hypothetical protein